MGRLVGEVGVGGPPSIQHSLAMHMLVVTMRRKKNIRKFSQQYSKELYLQIQILGDKGSLTSHGCHLCDLRAEDNGVSFLSPS